MEYWQYFVYFGFVCVSIVVYGTAFNQLLLLNINFCYVKGSNVRPTNDLDKQNKPNSTKMTTDKGTKIALSFLMPIVFWHTNFRFQT